MLRSIDAIDAPVPSLPKRCMCPLWVEGTANGTYIRRTLKTDSWERATDLSGILPFADVAIRRLPALTPSSWVVKSPETGFPRGARCGPQTADLKI
jgi:hypothetical protein